MVLQHLGVLHPYDDATSLRRVLQEKGPATPIHLASYVGRWFMPVFLGVFAFTEYFSMYTYNYIYSVLYFFIWKKHVHK
jgi:hypothetical protein